MSNLHALTLFKKTAVETTMTQNNCMKLVAHYGRDMNRSIGYMIFYIVLTTAKSQLMNTLMKKNN